jgi:hypothetical protein
MDNPEGLPTGAWITPPELSTLSTTLLVFLLNKELQTVHFYFLNPNENSPLLILK